MIICLNFKACFCTIPHIAVASTDTDTPTLNLGNADSNTTAADNSVWLSGAQETEQTAGSKHELMCFQRKITRKYALRIKIMHSNHNWIRHLVGLLSQINSPEIYLV